MSRLHRQPSQLQAPLVRSTHAQKRPRSQIIPEDVPSKRIVSLIFFPKHESSAEELIFSTEHRWRKKGRGANPVIRKRGTKPNSPIEVEAARRWPAAERRPPGRNCRNEQPMRNFLEDAELFFFSKGKFVSAPRPPRLRFSGSSDSGESVRARISVLPSLAYP